MADALKLVPVEPTEAMLRAMNEAIEDTPFLGDVEPDSYDQWRPCSEAAYRAMLAASPPAREEAPAEGAGDERTIDGETVLGFKVAAWRYQNASDADGASYGYRYCEHWSTPGNGAKAVERLFTETQLRAALRDRTSEPAREGAGRPVAWMRVTRGEITHLTHCQQGPGYQPLYTHPAPATADKLRAFDVEAYVEDYEFRSDEGDHTPTEDEKGLLIDAIHGVLAVLNEGGE